MPAGHGVRIGRPLQNSELHSGPQFAIGALQHRVWPGVSTATSLNKLVRLNWRFTFVRLLLTPFAGYHGSTNPARKGLPGHGPRDQIQSPPRLPRPRAAMVPGHARHPARRVAHEADHQLRRPRQLQAAQAAQHLQTAEDSARGRCAANDLLQRPPVGAGTPENCSRDRRKGLPEMRLEQGPAPARSAIDW